MLERRVRMGTFGAEEVPALRFEEDDVPPRGSRVIVARPEERFRPLEFDVASGGNDFSVQQVTIDGQEQLMSSGIRAWELHGSMLVMPNVEEDGSVELVIVNESDHPSSFLAFFLGRIPNSEEKPFP